MKATTLALDRVLWLRGRLWPRYNYMVSSVPPDSTEVEAVWSLLDGDAARVEARKRRAEGHTLVRILRRPLTGWAPWALDEFPVLTPEALRETRDFLKAHGR